MINKTISALALAAITALPALAQDARAGVSRPDESAIAAAPEDAAAAQTVVKQKPSAAIAAAPAKATGEEQEYGAYVPYTGAKAAMPAAHADAALSDEQADANVVTNVVDRPGELREGTLMRARLGQKLSTITTEPGSRFTAALTEAIEKDGRVVLPVGSTIQGRVTNVHGGRRISGAALIHLEAESVALPDGTRYRAHLQLIDTDQLNHTKIDREGSLVRRDHPKETLAAMGLATGGAAAAGAAIGGGVGAAVGAGIGAGAGTVVWLKQDRQEVVPAETLLVFSLSAPMALTPQSGAAISESRRPVLNPDSKAVGDQ